MVARAHKLPVLTLSLAVKLLWSERPSKNNSDEKKTANNKVYSVYLGRLLTLIANTIHPTSKRTSPDKWAESGHFQSMQERP